MFDRLKYELFYRMWAFWHMHSRRFFDGFTPRSPYAKYVCESRPRWHLCCNGDCGGWRTSVCDYLENKWRYTKFWPNWNKFQR